jgi:hypothetical protein
MMISLFFDLDIVFVENGNTVVITELREGDECTCL